MRNMGGLVQAHGHYGELTEEMRVVAREAAMRFPTAGSRSDFFAFVDEMGRSHPGLAPDTIQALTLGASELDTMARVALCKKFTP